MSENEELRTEQWRNRVDERMKGLEDKVATLSANVSAALTIHASNAQQITDNTRITLDLKEAMQRFEARAMPAIEVTETMQRGATAIGRTVEFVTRWGGRLWKATIFIGACWIAFKVMTSGGSWTEAVKAFFSFQQH